MKSLRLTLALLLTLAVPLTAAAGVAHADACAGHQVSAPAQHADHGGHHGAGATMPDDAEQAGCDTDCQCPTLHCNAGYALSNQSPTNDSGHYTALLPLITAAAVFPGFSNTPYRPPARG